MVSRIVQLMSASFGVILAMFAPRAARAASAEKPAAGPTPVEFFVSPQGKDAWSGTLGHPLHRMPQIGELGPGLWLASGFGGHGLNTTAMAGVILARAIVENDDSWRLFAPFELVWAGGRLGRAAMQVYYWWFDARERFAAKEARAREQDYRRAAELAALRAGHAGEEPGDAELGAVVRHLPEEPALAELPADPVRAEERER